MTEELEAGDLPYYFLVSAAEALSKMSFSAADNSLFYIFRGEFTLRGRLSRRVLSSLRGIPHTVSSRGVESVVRICSAGPIGELNFVVLPRLSHAVGVLSGNGPGVLRFTFIAESRLVYSDEVRVGGGHSVLPETLRVIRAVRDLPLVVRVGDFAKLVSAGSGRIVGGERVLDLLRSVSVSYGLEGERYFAVYQGNVTVSPIMAALLIIAVRDGLVDFEVRGGERE